MGKRALVVQVEAHAADGRTFGEVDQEFHRLLFSCLENELLTNLLGVFWQVYRTIHEAIDSLEGNTPGTTLTETAQIHRDILTAVQDRDKPAAARLMHRHFDGIREQLAEFALEA